MLFSLIDVEDVVSPADPEGPVINGGVVSPSIISTITYPSPSPPEEVAVVVFLAAS